MYSAARLSAAGGSPLAAPAVIAGARKWGLHSFEYNPVPGPAHAESVVASLPVLCGPGERLTGFGVYGLRDRGQPAEGVRAEEEEEEQKEKEKEKEEKSSDMFIATDNLLDLFNGLCAADHTAGCACATDSLISSRAFQSWQAQKPTRPKDARGGSNGKDDNENEENDDGYSPAVPLQSAHPYRGPLSLQPAFLRPRVFKLVRWYNDPGAWSCPGETDER